MIRFKQMAAVLLLICILSSLCACGGRGEDPTQPWDPTTATNATEQTVVTEPDYFAIYSDSRKAAQALQDLTLIFTYSQSRSVSGETYTETGTGTAVYTAYGTDEMHALVSETLACGSYEAAYYASYIDGQGYCRAENCSFSSNMTAAEFIASQLPVVLLNEENYASVQCQNEETGAVFTFSDALCPEGWVDDGDRINLSAASGTAWTDAEGRLIGTSYHAEFSYGNTVCTLDVTVQILTDTAPDFSGQPVYGENCAVLNDLRIPRLMMRVVGDLFDTETFTASYTDTLYSEFFPLIRSQSYRCDTFGSGDSLLASISNQISVTDYTGTAVANTQTISYAGGLYSYVTNNADPVTKEDVTPEQMRIYCEDMVLTSLFSLSSIRQAELVDTGDFLYIEFTGTEEYSDGICRNIYSILNMELDHYAESHNISASGGYLALNRFTGLPTAMGQYLECVDTISGVPYRLSYQLDQSLQLPSRTAHQTLTGEAEQETAPANSATPLFYHVTGQDGQEMWLLGTIHLGDARTAYLPDAIMDAFRSADALAVECNTLAFNESLLSDPQLQTQVAQLYYYSNGSTALSHLDEEAARQLRLLMRISGMNNINGPYMKVAIWNSLLEDFYLMQDAALAADKGMDNRLLAWAATQDKPVYEIESGLSQLQLLTGFSDALQQMQLAQLLDAGLLGYCGSVQELYTLWCSGDEEALTAYLTTDTSEMTDEELALWEEYQKAMYTDRNKVMLKVAKKYLNSEETVFYAVGLAHLLGEDGLVQSLRDAGYTVEPVTYE